LNPSWRRAGTRVLSDLWQTCGTARDAEEAPRLQRNYGAYTGARIGANRRSSVSSIRAVQTASVQGAEQLVDVLSSKIAPSVIPNYSTAMAISRVEEYSTSFDELAAAPGAPGRNLTWQGKTRGFSDSGERRLLLIVACAPAEGRTFDLRCGQRGYGGAEPPFLAKSIGSAPTS